MDTQINDDRMQKHYIRPEAILRYLVGQDDNLDTLIMCKSSQVNLVTSDAAVYEAMASVTKNDDFKLNKLAKFFEVVEIQSARRKKTVLTHEKVEQLRKIALGDANDKDNRD